MLSPPGNRPGHSPASCAVPPGAVLTNRAAEPSIATCWGGVMATTGRPGTGPEMTSAACASRLQRVPPGRSLLTPERAGPVGLAEFAGDTMCPKSRERWDA